MRPGVDEHAAWRRCGLEPRGCVYHIANGVQLAAGMERDERLAARHTDPHLQPAVLPEAGADAESGADRALGIILM